MSLRKRVTIINIASILGRNGFIVLNKILVLTTKGKEILQAWEEEVLPQGILLNVVWQLGWEGCLGDNGYMYM